MPFCFRPRRLRDRLLIVLLCGMMVFPPLPLSRALATTGVPGDDETPNCSAMCCENANVPGENNWPDEPWCCQNWPGDQCPGPGPTPPPNPPGPPGPPLPPPQPPKSPPGPPGCSAGGLSPFGGSCGPQPGPPTCSTVTGASPYWNTLGAPATKVGVHLKRGSFTSGSVDLSLSGPVFGWSHHRSYDSGAPNSSSARTLFWASGANYPRLYSGSGDEVSLAQSANSYRAFTGSAPNLTAPADYDASMNKASQADSDDLDNDTNTSEIIDIYTLTEHASGRVMIFLGFDADVETEYQGRLVEKTSQAYQAEDVRGVAYAYNSDGNVSVVTTAAPQSWRLEYSYTTAGGEKQADEIKVRDGPLVTDTIIQKAEYTYYDEVSPANTALGSDGDLVQVKLSRLAADGSSWLERFTQYRYYRSSDTDGKAHQMKMIFAPDAVQRAVDGEAAITGEDDMLSEADSLVDDYASRTLTYYTENLDTDNSGYTSCVTPWSDEFGEDLNSAYGGSEFDEYNSTDSFGAVKTVAVGGCAACGAANTGIRHSFFYMQLNGGSSTNPDEVVHIAVVDAEDGASPRVARFREIWGINDHSSSVRETFIEDPTQTTVKAWCKSRKFNSDLRVTESRLPSAHTAIDTNSELTKFLNPTSSTNDSDTVSSSAGVVYYYEYSSSFGDGTHRTGVQVREGAGAGSRYYVSATDWGKGADDEPTDVVLARYVYPQQVTSRADSSRIKIATYSYDFWDAGDTSIKQITTTEPAISASQNGSGVATATYMYYDEEGRLRWTKDGEGYVNYYSYHPDLGRHALVVQDVNTASLNSDITGTGSGKWVAWSGGAGLTRGGGLPSALELTTKIEYDDLARAVKTTDAGGSQHYTRYETGKVLQFMYWTGGTSGSAELPVEVREMNDAGVITETYAVKPSKSQWDSGSGLPKLASYTSADYVSRTVSSYDATSGRLEHVDRYHDADAVSGGYYRTSYLYDDLGRVGTTVQEVASSRYQVSAQLFDALGRIVETRRGVATAAPTDYGALDNDPPGTPTNFNGYATVSETAYDSGGVGDGFVTSSKSYYGTGSHDYLESLPQRTFRGHARGVLQKNGTTKFGPYRVQDIDWLGRTTASATYATEPTWPTGYSDHVIYSSGGSVDQPKTSGHHNVSVLKYDDLGRAYRTLHYPGSEATKHFETSTFYDRRGSAVASESVHGLSSERAYDGAGRPYQQRMVLSLESTKYTSGAFNYRAPLPDSEYGVGDEGQMSGGDDQVVSLIHSVFDDGSNVTQSHTLEAHHDDTDGMALTADDDYVRSSRYNWYDAADRIEVSAYHGADDGVGTGTGSWQYTALPSSVTKPTSSSAAELVTKFGYHTDRGRLDLVTDPSGTKTKTFFDDLGRTTYVAKNYVNFDPANVGTTVGGGTHDQEDQVVGFQYNGLGGRTKLTAYNASSSTADQVTEYKFEDNYSASLVTQEIYPDGDNVSDNVQRTHHLDGSLNTRTDQRGVVFTNSYDNARRPTLQAATTIPSSVDNHVQSIGRAYDNLGRIETITSYAGTTTATTVRNQIKYTYGTHGNITRSEQDHSGSVGGTEPSVQYAYDDSAASNIYNDALRLETMTYPDGRAVFYGYDNATQGTLRDRAGRIAEIRQTNSGGQQLVTYETTGGGRVANTVYPQPDIHQHADRDGDDVYEVWDRFGRTLQSYWRPTTGSGNNYLDRYDYGYDNASNRTYRNQRVDMISAATLDERDQAYTYDGLDRVIDTDQGTANDTTGAITTKKFEQQWKLDQLGNWEEFDQDDNGNGTWDLEQSRTHNDANEVTAVDLQSMGAGTNWADPAFDAAGNMTTLPQPGSLASSYTAKYDAWNRLVSLDSGTTASYAYDGLNRRIQRTEGSTTRHFYYNEKWQVLEERATEAGDAVKQFVWGAQYVDELVLRDRDADSNAGNGLEERLYALSDAQYNITTLVNTSGSVQERFSYAPYGASTVLNADLTVKGGGTGYAWEHRYTGRRLDPGSGLQLNRNRYYHQQLGRWCSRDPVGYMDGWNVFSYVSNGPLVHIDPSGEICQKKSDEPSCEKLFPFKDHLPDKDDFGNPLPDPVTITNSALECLKKHAGKPDSFLKCLANEGIDEIFENLTVNAISDMAKYLCCSLREAEGAQFKDACSCGRNRLGRPGPCHDPTKPWKGRVAGTCAECCQFHWCLNSFNVLVELIGGGIKRPVLWAEMARKRDLEVCLADCGNK